MLEPAFEEEEFLPKRDIYIYVYIDKYIEIYIYIFTYTHIYICKIYIPPQTGGASDVRGLRDQICTTFGTKVNCVRQVDFR